MSASLYAQAPNNPIYVTEGPKGIDSITVFFAGEKNSPVNISKVYLYYGPASDTVNIVNNYADTRRPNDSITLNEISLGQKRVARGLTGETPYYFYTATVNATGLFCARDLVRASMRMIQTAPFPLNYLDVTATPGYTTVDLTISNIDLLSPSTTYKNQVLILIGTSAIVTDPSDMSARHDTVDLSTKPNVYTHTVRNLNLATTYYISITYKNLQGHFAKIDTVAPYINARVAATKYKEIIPPDVSGLAFSVRNDPANRSSQALYTITGASSVAEPDRSTMILRVAWAEADYVRDPALLEPSAGNYQDHAAPVGDPITDFQVTGLYPNRTYYFSLFASDTVGNWSAWSQALAGTVQLDSSQYAPNPPWLENLEAAQINDSFIRVRFTPRDNEENRVKVTAVYSIDGTAGDTLKFQGLRRAGFVSLYDDICPVGQPCSAYVKLHSEFTKTVGGAPVSDFYFRNNDTTSIALTLYADDQYTASPDSAVALGAIRADLRPPMPPNLSYSINYTRSTQTAVVTVTDNLPGDLSTVHYGPSAAARYQNSLAFAGAPLNFTVNGVDQIHFAFADSFGNAWNAFWSDFVEQTLNFQDHFSQHAGETLSYNSDDLRLFIYSTALHAANPGMNLKFKIFDFTPDQITWLSAQGFSSVRNSGYVFVSAGDPGGSPFYKDGVRIMMRTDTPDSSLRMYRYFRDATGAPRVEFIGGRLLVNTATVPETYYVAADSLGRDSITFYDYFNTSAEGAPAAADSHYLFLAVDNQLPAIDASQCFIWMENDSIVLQLFVSDNTVNLDAQIKIFGFEGEARNLSHAGFPVIFDTLTLHDFDGPGSAGPAPGRHFKCGMRGYSDADPMYASPPDPLNKTWATFNRGLYAAVWINDSRLASRRKRLFLTADLPPHTLSGAYTGMNNWTLISFPAERADPLHVMEVLKPSFTGKYDNQRIRLYKLNDNIQNSDNPDPWLEFSPLTRLGEIDIDPGFFFLRGSAFLAITQAGRGDQTVYFSADNVQAPVYKGDRGYVLASAAAENYGFRLFSLPFRGTVRLTAVEAVSATSNPRRLGDRMWKLESATNQWRKLDPLAQYDRYAALLTSAGDYNECFLAYLYPGDELAVPFTDDRDFIDQSRYLTKAAASPVWQAGVALLDPLGREVESGHVIGVVNGPGRSFPDLPALNSAALSIMQSDRPLSESFVPNNGRVAAWTLLAANREAAPADLVLDLGLADAGIPESLSVYLKDNKGGFACDLRESRGQYAFSLSAMEERSFEVLVGQKRDIEARGLRDRPAGFSLYANHPNPFNPRTVIGFAVPALPRGRARAVLEVFDLSGRLVRTLLDRAAAPGYYRAAFDSGREASGVYIYRLSVKDGAGRLLFTKSRRMVLLK